MKRVICPYCGQKFDADAEDFVKVDRRYYHKACHKKEEDNKYVKQDLLNFCARIFGDKANMPLIEIQYKQYIQNDGLEPIEILNALVYYYDIQHKPIDGANGAIGIVPYVWFEAKKYVEEIGGILKANAGKEIKERPAQVITIAPPQREQKKSKRFSFLEEER